MLPCLVKVQQFLGRRISERIQQEVRRKTHAFDAPRTVLFEGDHLSISRADGSFERDRLKPLEATANVSKEELHSGTEVIGATIESIAEQVAKQQIKIIIEEMGKTPNQVDSGGSFSAETLLQALEKIAIDFDEGGNPSMPTLVMHPDLYEKTKDVFIAAESDPNYRERFDQIISQKRKEWHDRESSRKLVD